MDAEICKKCRYYGGVRSTVSNRIFGACVFPCVFPPYKVKFIAEIEKCPKYADGTKYRCIKAFSVRSCDDDGAFEAEKKVEVAVGDIYKVKTVSYLYVAPDGAIHLEDDNGNWIEIMPETLSEHFEFITT